MILAGHSLSNLKMLVRPPNAENDRHPGICSLWNVQAAQTLASWASPASNGLRCSSLRATTKEPYSGEGSGLKSAGFRVVCQGRSRFLRGDLIRLYSCSSARLEWYSMGTALRYCSYRSSESALSQNHLSLKLLRSVDGMTRFLGSQSLNNIERASG